MADGIRGLVVKLVERCNLNCSYCYMYNHPDQSYASRPKVMSDTVYGDMLARVDEYLSTRAPRRMTLTFHGGEPTLVGAARFRQLLEYATARLGERVRFALQTNAVLIDDAWCDVLGEYDVSVGVSLDGPAPIHDRVRTFHNGSGSYAATVAGLERLQRAGIRPGVLTVINVGEDGLAIYRHLRDMSVRRLDFLLPEMSHDTARLMHHSSRTPVADYLIPIFDAWFAEDDPDVSIRLFEAIIRVLLGGSSGLQSIGSEPLNYLVVETDGTLHADDCLKVCVEGLSDTGLNVFDHGLADLSQAVPLIHTLMVAGLPVATGCRNCPELTTCGGGCAPLRYSRERGFDNPSVWCQDLKALIGHTRAAVLDAEQPATLLTA